MNTITQEQIIRFGDCAINLFVIKVTILERSPFSLTQFTFVLFKVQIGVEDTSLTIATSITNKLIADSFISDNSLSCYRVHQFEKFHRL